MSEACVSMLSAVFRDSTSTSRPVSAIDCSNFTAAVAWYTGIFCLANQKLNSITSTVEAMMITRRRRTISQ